MAEEHYYKAKLEYGNAFKGHTVFSVCLKSEGKISSGDYSVYYGELLMGIMQYKPEGNGKIDLTEITKEEYENFMKAASSKPKNTQKLEYKNIL